MRQLFVFFTMKKVALHTLGCKLNFAETSTLGRQFVDNGFDVVDVDERADVFLLNTCSVTERADTECRQIIRRALRRSPEAYVIVVGCYAQLQPEEISRIEGVDLILGTNDKFKIFEHEKNFVKKEIPQTFVSCIDDVSSIDMAYSAEVGGRTRAFLKIQDGCDYHCSFCTIPLARGASRSLSPVVIIDQARALASRGFKEIVLTGVNVGDYGTKISVALISLLEALDRIEGIERIRISSLEPNLLTRELVDFILSSEKFCNHFHIPLQSGSNAILKLMRRRYRTEQYESIVEYIKSCGTDAGIGADVIVGFPGEEQRHFDETRSFLAELPISYLHVFTYSERERTPAESFGGVVQPNIRFERSEILRMLGMKKRREFASTLVGNVMPVLFESRQKNGMISGLTSNYVRVETDYHPSLVNELTNVAVETLRHEGCGGTVVAQHHQQKGSSLSELYTNQTCNRHNVPQEVGFS